jgi:hypothetical protein
MYTKMTLAAMLTAVVCLIPLTTAHAGFPEYFDQHSANPYVHSGICTYDGPVVSDVQFAEWVTAAVPTDEDWSSPSCSATAAG